MRTILLADDDANLRTLVHTTLEDPNYRILEAPDGRVALALAQKEHPDLLLLDWLMPGLTGIAVMKHLHADPSTASIPIIMLTEKRLQKDRKQAQGLGVHSYLVKPFSPLELIQKVHEVLGT